MNNRPYLDLGPPGSPEQPTSPPDEPEVSDDFDDEALPTDFDVDHVPDESEYPTEEQEARARLRAAEKVREPRLGLLEFPPAILQRLADEYERCLDDIMREDEGKE